MTAQTNLKSRIARLLDRRLPRNPSRRDLIRLVVVFTVVLAAIGTVGLRSSHAQETPEHVYQMSDGVTAPALLYRIEPQYTEDARAAKVEGTVLLNVIVGTDGLAHDISIVKGLDSGLDLMAMQAIAKWRFQPGTLDGQPVAVRARIEVNFRLQ